MEGEEHRAQLKGGVGRKIKIERWRQKRRR
jgi:hypothetical protein